MLYSSVSADSTSGPRILDAAVDTLLTSLNEEQIPRVLWRMHYEQISDAVASTDAANIDQPLVDGTHVFPLPSLDLALDDSVLDEVKQVWDRVGGPDTDEFLKFPAREGLEDEQDQEI